MLDRLPEYIDPLHLADKRCELKGRISLSNLDRLAEMLADDKGSVAFDLLFGREGRLAKIDGRIEADLELKCQNCLQAVQWSVNSEVKLGIVTSIDQANRLPEDYEPLLVEEEKVLLKNIIEDELLLVLPMFPKHQHACLIPNLGDSDVDSIANSEHSSPQTPFSILANLKKTGDL
jgi:uncharacterized protein